MLTNQPDSGFNERIYIYLRYTVARRVLVAVNFNREDCSLNLKLPDDLLRELNVAGHVKFTDLLSGALYTTTDIHEGLDIILSASNGVMLRF